MKDGSKYAGEWREDEIHGWGTANYGNGEIYIGSFLEGKRQGRGTMRYATGAVASGIWLDGTLRPKVIEEPTQ